MTVPESDEWLTKTCRSCKVTRLRQDFGPSTRSADGLTAKCLECQGLVPKPTKAELQRARNLKARYGVTVSEYERLLQHQGGVCFICGRKPGRVRLAVDHNHKTGEVRGLLCPRGPRSCNRGLGVFADSADRLELAADYLRNPPTRRFNWRDPA